MRFGELKISQETELVMLHVNFTEIVHMVCEGVKLFLQVKYWAGGLGGSA